MKHKKLLLVAILLLGVGFALVSTILYLNGNVKIATNNADFNVIFTKAIIDGTNTPSAISEDGKTITFETKDLSTVGNISKIDFVVVNNSTMYDADVSIDCSANGDKSSYYEITKEVASPIAGKTTGIGNVQVKLLKASVEDFSETFACTLHATAKERTENATPPVYYAFGDPLTLEDRTTDYTTLKYPDTDVQAKLFVKLDADGVQKSVCTLATGSLECFRGGTTAYVAEEQEHLKRVFGESNCPSNSSGVGCRLGAFYCSVSSDGYISCEDNASSVMCMMNSDGSSNCYA